MRHKKIGRKFGRETDQRKAFLKSLAVNLLLKGKIKTTQARAKEMRRLVERLITKAKKNDLAAIRLAAKNLPQPAVKKLIREIAPRYLDRPGGYTRIIKIGRRASDGAEMVFIELV